MPDSSPIRHRRSIRLRGYDYSQSGAYFVTLVAWQRGNIFGRIDQDVVALTPLGKIASEEWIRSADMRAEIQIHADEFLVMPNHLHGIVWIVREDEIENKTVDPTHPRVARSLSSFIAGYKAAVTSRARRELGMDTIWQRNYFEHIIRSDEDWKALFTYIQENPRCWAEDQLYPK